MVNVPVLHLEFSLDKPLNKMKEPQKDFGGGEVGDRKIRECQELRH